MANEGATKASTKQEGFTEEERAAMKDRAKEVRSARSGSKAKDADGEKDLLEKIAAMTDSDRAIAERVHTIVTENAPQLAPKTYYGMPAWALNGKVICFFKPSQKFKTRYSSFEFNDSARLDEGTMWPISYAVMSLDADTENRIAELVRQALS